MNICSKHVRVHERHNGTILTGHTDTRTWAHNRPTDRLTDGNTAPCNSSTRELVPASVRVSRLNDNRRKLQYLYVHPAVQGPIPRIRVPQHVDMSRRGPRATCGDERMRIHP